MPHKELYVDGVWHPSVTTVMASKPKPWVDTWREKWGGLAERKTLLAQVIGTEMHRCIESFVNIGSYDVQVPVDETGRAYPSLVLRIQGMMQSFVRWAETTEGIIETTEQTVISSKYRYSGTLDAKGKISKDHLGLEDGDKAVSRGGRADKRLCSSGRGDERGESTVRESRQCLQAKAALSSDRTIVQNEQEGSK